MVRMASLVVGSGWFTLALGRDPEIDPASQVGWMRATVTERRLAAILSADVVGYSRLMAAVQSTGEKYLIDPSR